MISEDSDWLGSDARLNPRRDSTDSLCFVTYRSSMIVKESNGVPGLVIGTESRKRAIVELPKRFIQRLSLRHHLGAGDFSRWASEVNGDEQLPECGHLS